MCIRDSSPSPSPCQSHHALLARSPSHASSNQLVVIVSQQTQSPPTPIATNLNSHQENADSLKSPLPAPPTTITAAKLPPHRRHIVADRHGRLALPLFPRRLELSLPASRQSGDAFTSCSPNKRIKEAPRISLRRSCAQVVLSQNDSTRCNQSRA